MESRNTSKPEDVCEYDGYTINHDAENSKECQRRDEAKQEFIRFSEEMKKKYGSI